MVHSVEVSFLLRPLLRQRLTLAGAEFVESRRLLVSSFAVSDPDPRLLASLKALTPYVDR
jgi:hypothetical protein